MLIVLAVLAVVIAISCVIMRHVYLRPPAVALDVTNRQLAVDEVLVSKGDSIKFWEGRRAFPVTIGESVLPALNVVWTFHDGRLTHVDILGECQPGSRAGSIASQLASILRLEGVGESAEMNAQRIAESSALKPSSSNRVIGRRSEHPKVELSASRCDTNNSWTLILSVDWEQ